MPRHGKSFQMNNKYLRELPDLELLERFYVLLGSH